MFKACLKTNATLCKTGFLTPRHQCRIEELQVQDDNHSAYVIAYMFTSFSGFLMGLLLGWIIWG